jgi:DNA-binding NtrC family response regulator
VGIAVRAADVLLVVADESLRAVLQIALSMDGYRVRTATSAQATLDALATTRPAVLMLDTLTALGADPVRWAAHHAADTPLLLLVPAWDDTQHPPHPNVATLTLPFGREDLRRALAATAALRDKPATIDNHPSA